MIDAKRPMFVSAEDLRLYECGLYSVFMVGVETPNRVIPIAAAPTQGADARPVAIIPTEWLTLMEECATFHGKMVKGNWLSSEAKRLLATRDAAPSDAQDAARYRWLSKRVVITDGSTPGLMVITVVDDGVETTNKFLDEFTEQAIAASALREKTS